MAFMAKRVPAGHGERASWLYMSRSCKLQRFPKSGTACHARHAASVRNPAGLRWSTPAHARAATVCGQRVRRACRRAWIPSPRVAAAVAAGGGDRGRGGDASAERATPRHSLLASRKCFFAGTSHAACDESGAQGRDLLLARAWAFERGRYSGRPQSHPLCLRTPSPQGTQVQPTTPKSPSHFFFPRTFFCLPEGVPSLRPQGQATMAFRGSVVDDAVERRALASLRLQRLPPGASHSRTSNCLLHRD